MIEYLVMDVDGTLTDGKIYMGTNGEVMKAFSIKDGCGIHDILMPAGIKPIIITGRKSRIVEIRCAELGITKCYQGVKDKLDQLKKISSNFKNIAYIGDDINDLIVMNAVKNAGGRIGCPSDATEEVRQIADFISTRCGGDGAVREFIEWLIKIESSL
ncbi:MAG: 3-deoxy-D-manno-octulosonate 8-phosphate phosphatase [Oscillospiraceae bacterium]|nr:3-deoxy-D-manno-octulosonate 8-phosphate phosphatase [Oscillospiraceae bacterium]